MNVVVAALAVLVLAAACGGEDDGTAAPPTQAQPAAPTADCVAAGATGARVYEVCPEHGRRGHGHFYVEEDGQRRVLDVAAPTVGPAGHWAWAQLASDGEMLLAQWIAECEIPVAYFVPSRGGTPRPVTPADVESIALGWTADGEAEVALPRGGCGKGTGRPGVYAVSPSGGAPTYLREIDPATDRPRG